MSVTNTSHASVYMDALPMHPEGYLLGKVKAIHKAYSPVVWSLVPGAFH